MGHESTCDNGVYNVGTVPYLLIPCEVEGSGQLYAAAADPPGERTIGWAWNSRLFRLQSQSGILPLPGIESRFCSHPPHSLVTTFSAEEQMYFKALIITSKD